MIIYHKHILLTYLINFQLIHIICFPNFAFFYHKITLFYLKQMLLNGAKTHGLFSQYLLKTFFYSILFYLFIYLFIYVFVCFFFCWSITILGFYDGLKQYTNYYGPNQRLRSTTYCFWNAIYHNMYHQNYIFH